MIAECPVCLLPAVYIYEADMGELMYRNVELIVILSYDLKYELQYTLSGVSSVIILWSTHLR